MGSPYLAGEVDFENALNLTLEPIREFMFKHTEKDLAIFLEARGGHSLKSRKMSAFALVPAFVISG